MKKELKVKIEDYKKVEERLKRLGAKFLETINVKDTYYNQDSNDVLKVTEDDKGNFLVKLRSENGGFVITEYKQVNNTKDLKAKLEHKFGIESILVKERRFWQLGKLSFNINLIKELGDFLILEDENPKKEVITKIIGIKNPEWVRVPFNKFKKRDPKNTKG